MFIYLLLWKNEFASCENQETGTHCLLCWSVLWEAVSLGAYHRLCGGQRRCAFDFQFVLECGSKIQHRAESQRATCVCVLGGGGRRREPWSGALGCLWICKQKEEFLQNQSQLNFLGLTVSVLHVDLCHLKCLFSPCHCCFCCLPKLERAISISWS